MTTLAVVIPTRNMASTLGRAIGSACHGGADEVVVVDDASEDETPAVVEQWQSEFGQVRYVRHRHKLPDHVAAQRDAWLSLASDQIIGMGADDYLLPGAITALKQHADAAVVFGDAEVIAPDGRYLYPHLSGFYGVRSAADVRLRLQSPAGLMESGFGSALRADMARWLWDMQWERMGPVMDSVGYATVAAIHGAAYVSAKTVAITISEQSYGHRSNWTDEQIAAFAQAALQFMREAGLDEATVAALARKRCYA